MSIVNEEICSELGLKEGTCVTMLRYELEDKLDEARTQLQTSNFENLKARKEAYDEAEERYSRFMEENFNQ